MSRPPRLGSRAVRVELGLIAFSPAMGLLAFRAREDLAWLLIFGLPAVLGLAIALATAMLLQGGSAEPFSFASIDDAGDELIGHVGSYLVPAVIDVGESTEQAVIAAVALALIVHIHVATGRVHVNPLLYVFGYRIHRATSTTGVAYYLVARTDVSLWESTRLLIPLGASLLVERSRDAKAPHAGR